MATGLSKCWFQAVFIFDFTEITIPVFLYEPLKSYVLISSLFKTLLFTTPALEPFPL